MPTTVPSLCPEGCYWACEHGHRPAGHWQGLRPLSPQQWPLPGRAIQQATAHERLERDLQTQDPAAFKWRYDPEWEAFVRKVLRWEGQTASVVDQVIYEETLAGQREWAAGAGLDAERVAYLKRHPTPGCYNGRSPL